MNLRITVGQSHYGTASASEPPSRELIFYNKRSVLGLLYNKTFRNTLLDDELEC